MDEQEAVEMREGEIVLLHELHTVDHVDVHRHPSELVQLFD